MEENNLPKIIRAQKQQKDKIKGVLKLGFSSDPLIRWVFPDPNIYLVNFDTWMDEFSKISFSNDVVFAEENFYGASIWHPPGFEFDETCLYPTLEWMTEERIEFVSQFFEEFSNYHPDDAWYLAFIGVDPSKQGLGVGSFILKEALKTIDERGERAYLESSNPRNMSLYERHGFESMGKVQIGDSPPAHPMIREPRK